MNKKNIMWFEILILCVSAMFIYTKAKYDISNYEMKIHLAVWVVAPTFFMLLYHKLLSIKGMLIIYLLVFFWIGAKRLFGRINEIPRFISDMVKAVIMVIFYVLVLKNYLPEEHSEELRLDEAVLIFAGISVVLFFSGKISKWICKQKENNCFWRYLSAEYLMAAVPIFGFYIMECAFNSELKSMRWEFAVGNIVWLSALFAVAYCLFPNKKIVAGIFLTVCMAFGVGNYFVSMFRGSPIMPNDLLSVGTAFQVAGGYEIQISGQIIDSVLYWYGGITILCCFPADKSEKTGRFRMKKVIIASFVVCICSYYLTTVKIEEKYNWQLSQWDVKDSYQAAGSTFGFTALLQKMSVEKPDGYSSQKAMEILAEYSTKQESMESCKETNRAGCPTIIAIMDETFSDLRTLGDIICSEEYLENWYAIEDFACKGKAYVSVYGGGTANSEFEFLTGNSIGNCPVGVIPYQSYDLGNIGNMAAMLGNAGYETTAIHPEYKGNWNRMRTYANFGFHTFLGKDDFTDPVLLRSHISDQTSFDKIIEVYEKGRGKKQFIFNVTMQNHGGYNIDDLSGTSTIKLKDSQTEYTDVATYLTLIRESDKSIHNLIEYFRKVKEPVVLCIFGDHLPSLNSEWVEEVMGKPGNSLSIEEVESKYAVPYMIWANYDTPYQKQEMDTSVNYLGELLLENARIPQSAYTGFLQQMRKEIPIYNAFGYQTSDGTWHESNENTDVSGWIENYKILQYNALFDTNRVMENYR